MHAGQAHPGVPSQYPSDRASQVSQIGGTVNAGPHDFKATENTTVSTDNTTGRVAVITGASSIGEATARAEAT